MALARKALFLGRRLQLPIDKQCCCAIVIVGRNTQNRSQSYLRGMKRPLLARTSAITSCPCWSGAHLYDSGPNGRPFSRTHVEGLVVQTYGIFSTQASAANRLGPASRSGSNRRCRSISHIPAAGMECQKSRAPSRLASISIRSSWQCDQGLRTVSEQSSPNSSPSAGFRRRGDCGRYLCQ